MKRSEPMRRAWGSHSGWSLEGGATRRELLALGAACLALPATISHAAEPIGRARPSHFKLSLAAFSYRDYLTGPKKSMDLFDFVNLAADLELDAVEPTGYYFPNELTPD